MKKKQLLATKSGFYWCVPNGSRTARIVEYIETGSLFFLPGEMGAVNPTTFTIISERIKPPDVMDVDSYKRMS